MLEAVANPETATPAIDDEVVMPALLRSARGSYAQAVRTHLADEGFDDLPRNGPFVLGGMARFNASAADMITGLGVSKQAASQLIDLLVVRGYLTREVDPDDRRRMTISLTERGRGAAKATRSAVDSIDAELATMITPAELAGLQAGLTALGQIEARAPHVHPHDLTDGGGQRGTRTLDLADVNRAL
jgi:DNA-binding MarR family transcriptional regulator